MTNHKRIAIALTLCLALIMTGCTANQVLTDLEAVATTMGAVLPALATAVNLPPAVANAIGTYANQVNTAAEQAQTILNNGPLTPAEAAQIAALFAGIIAPDLPAGTPQLIASAVSAVADAVANFLSHLATGAKSLPASGVKLDKAKLSQIKTKLDANVALLRARVPAK